MEAISYKLPDFEGPLDLLLFLVQKNKLNILDIPIHEVLDQYMEAIRRMQEADLDVATEFLEMAARLVQIKSSMLLPRHEGGRGVAPGAGRRADRISALPGGGRAGWLACISAATSSSANRRRLNRTGPTGGGIRPRPCSMPISPLPAAANAGCPCLRRRSAASFPVRSCR